MILGDRKRKFFKNRLPSMDSGVADIDLESDDLDLNTGLELLETYNRDIEFELQQKEEVKTAEEAVVADTVHGAPDVKFEHAEGGSHAVMEKKPFTFQLQEIETSTSDAGVGCSSMTDIDLEEYSFQEDMTEDEVDLDFKDYTTENAAQSKRYFPYRRSQDERGKQSASGVTRIKSSSFIKTDFFKSLGEASGASGHTPSLRITETKRESFDVHCEACRALHSHNNLVECLHPHFICKQCVEKSAKPVLIGEGKGDIDCPVKDCSKSVPQSELRKALPSIVIDLLEECWKKYALETIKTMEDAVNCPGCGIMGLTDPNSKLLNCSNCRKQFCHLCGMEWNKKSHDLCYTMKTHVATETGTQIQIPAHWSDAKEIEGRGFVEVEVDNTSGEYYEIAKLFMSSMGCAKIKKIYRIQNKRLWEKYSLVRSHMVSDLGEEDIKERRLFHGSSPGVIMAICKEGFDWRLSGKNGETYGMGTYFARNASYSDRYVRNKPNGNYRNAVPNVSAGAFAMAFPGPGSPFQSFSPPQQQFATQTSINLPGPALPTGGAAGTPSWLKIPPFMNVSLPQTSSSDNVDMSHIDGKLMFVGRVLVGRTCVGNPTMRRPEKDRLNNTCHTAVDNIDNPYIFVVFDMAQCYPEYIIQYQRR